MLEEKKQNQKVPDVQKNCKTSESYEIGSYAIPEMPEIILPKAGNEDRVDQFGIHRIGD